MVTLNVLLVPEGAAYGGCTPFSRRQCFLNAGAGSPGRAGAWGTHRVPQIKMALMGRHLFYLIESNLNSFSLKHLGLMGRLSWER